MGGFLIVIHITEIQFLCVDGKFRTALVAKAQCGRSIVVEVNVGNGLAQESTISRWIVFDIRSKVESCRWIGVVGKFVIFLAEEVGIFSGARCHVVGWHNGHQLHRIIVDGILFPSCRHIRHMRNHHALVADIRVPTLSAAVLYHIILVGIKWTLHFHCPVGSDGLAVEHWQAVFCVGLRCNEFNPTEERFFVSIVAHRGVAVIVVAAIVHQAPCAHTVFGTVSGHIEVGQTEAVREFVAECAYAVEHGVGVETPLHLIEYGKLIHCDAVVVLHTGTIAHGCCICQSPLARPNSIGHCGSSLRFAHTGKHHHHHIANAIAIVIVVCPINVGVLFRQIARLSHHLCHALVRTVEIIATIRFTVFAQLIHAKHIKLWFKLAVRLVDKILSGTVGSLVVVIAECVNGVAHLLVGKLHHNDWHPHLAHVRHLACLNGLLHMRHNLLTHHRGLHIEKANVLAHFFDNSLLVERTLMLVVSDDLSRAFEGVVAVITRLITHHNQPVVGSKRVEKFIAQCLN